jgi:hypothetical protein
VAIIIWHLEKQGFISWSVVASYVWGINKSECFDVQIEVTLTLDWNIEVSRHFKEAPYTSEDFTHSVSGTDTLYNTCVFMWSFRLWIN